MPTDSSQFPSLNDQRRISTMETPIGVDVKAELGVPPPDAAPQPAPVNPTMLAPSAKSFELLRQLEALAHEVAVVSRRYSSDQCIKVPEGPNFSAGPQTVEPSIRVSPHEHLASYTPSFGKRTSLTLANFFIAARNRLAIYTPSFGKRTSLTLAIFIATLIGVAATFVWQSQRVSTAKSPNDVAVAEKQSGVTPVGQVPLQNSPPQPAPVTQTAPAPTAPAAAAQEQLAAKQEQIDQNIAKPQAVKRDIKHKMSSPPRRNAPPGPAAQALSVPRPAPNLRPTLPVPPDRR